MSPTRWLVLAFFLALSSFAPACSKSADNNENGDPWETTNDLGMDASTPDMRTEPDMQGEPDLPSADDMAEPDAGVPVMAIDRLQWWVSVLDAGAPLTQEEFEANFADNVLATNSLDGVNEYIARWGEHGPVTIVAIQQEEEIVASALIAEGSGVEWSLQVVLDAETRRISNISSNPNLLNNPNRAQAKGPDEVFITIRAVSWPVLAGATVALWDPTTGQPLDPEVSGVTDNYGFVRLTMPAGLGEFALHATGPDGYQTLLYNRNFIRGSELSPQIIDRALAAEAATRAGETVDTTKGIIFPIGLWTGPNGDTPVGCATVDRAPQDGTVSYASQTAGGLPDPMRTSTDPVWSSVWMFNVDPVAHDVTFTAGVEQATVTLPTVLQDGWTVTHAYYDTASFPVAPGCYEPIAAEACDTAGMTPSQGTAERAMILFRNSTGSLIDVFWLDFEGNAQPYFTLPAGSEQVVSTFVGHKWRVQPAGDPACIDVYTAVSGSGLVDVQ